MIEELNKDREHLRRILQDGGVQAPDGFSEMVRARVSRVNPYPSKNIFSDWMRIAALYPLLLAIGGIIVSALEIVSEIFPRYVQQVKGVEQLCMNILTNQTFLLVIVAVLALWWLDRLLERYTQYRQAQLS